MKNFNFVSYVCESVENNLPLAYKEITKYKTLYTLVQNALNQENSKFSRSLKNHFDKLVNHLKNTSEKRLAIAHGESVNAKEQQIIVLNALLSFLKIACQREKDGIRNAYISFARARRQKYVRSAERDDAYRGRPNLYTNLEYKYVVNRAVKLSKAKAQRQNKKPLVTSKPKVNNQVRPIRKSKVRSKRKQ